VYQRVVVDRDQAMQPEVTTTQQVPEVVVLPEERVEAPVHRDGRAVGQLLGPSADAAAEVSLAFYHVDGHAALDQAGGGGQSGDARTDHHGVRPRPQQSGVGQAGMGRVRDAARIEVTVAGHAGACARNV